MDWKALAEKSCLNEKILEEEACAVLSCSDESLLSLLGAAYNVRRRFFGRRVKLNFLLNAKSGLCSDDCFYCSQSKISKAPIDKYPFVPEEEILRAASRAVELKAKRFCMVHSGRAPTENELEGVCSAVRKVKEKYPALEVCESLGFLKPRQAQELKECGVDAYNHNLNTSTNHYSKICTTHAYQKRLETVKAVKETGLLSCSGCIFGVGESDKDIVEIAFTLRDVGVNSIPINFLMPIAGTPFEGKNELTPQRCLKIICLFRFVNPKSEIRIAGGRELNLRCLQPMGLYAANSIFIGDYLTTKGQSPEADLAMIEDLGFEIEGYESKEKVSCPE